MKDEQKVYLKGDSERGDEVIKYLEDLEGSNTLSLHGNRNEMYYFINPEGIIDATYIVGGAICPFIKEFYEEITLPKWKPEYDENYYRITWIGEVAEDIWYGSRNDESGYKFGNCFRTKEEAEVARDKIKEILNK